MAAAGEGSRYRSTLRARQAAETRRSVLDAASDMFRERGWAGTTMAAVAARAGTAVETVYAGFGSKAGLLTAAIDAALVGDDGPTPLAERPEFTSLGSGDLATRLHSGAALIAAIHARSVPLLRALQEAAAGDLVAADRWQRYEQDRSATIALGLKLTTGRRPAQRVTDAVWALASPEVFGKLVLDRGWSTRAYRRWLVAVVTAQLEGTRR